MKLFKTPEFENDSYMIQLSASDELADVPSEDLEYFEAKLKAFHDRSIDKHQFKKFKDSRGSFASYDDATNMAGTVYTYTCEPKNRTSYEFMLAYSRRHRHTSRRCAINFADTFIDYINPRKNTSCLNSIHYHMDNVTIYFRASDVKHELLIDLKLIKQFFIDPVGEFKTITVIASTSQNIIYNFNHLIK